MAPIGSERSGLFQKVYPDALRESELALIQQRPGRENAESSDLIGFALSGGGIRSATFCLGVFQALARLNLLRQVDYLSSVSGGGFFAAFYGRLFTRDDVKDIGDVAEILRPDETHPHDGGDFEWKRRAFRWLRSISTSRSGKAIASSATT